MGEKKVKELLHFVNDGISAANVGIAGEALSGNIVKEMGYRGEHSAYTAVLCEIQRLNVKTVTVSNVDTSQFKEGERLFFGKNGLTSERLETLDKTERGDLEIKKECTSFKGKRCIYLDRTDDTCRCISYRKDLIGVERCEKCLRDEKRENEKASSNSD